MSTNPPPDLSLYLHILQTLEQIEVPYMVIGAFAGTFYGITRTTFDIDIIVLLSEKHIQALADSYPLPRYYADPYQMRNAIQIKSIFNIIDIDRGEKVDMFPLQTDARYKEAFERRIRRTIRAAHATPFEIWCARPEDVIIGKLMAWAESQSRRHETDIYEIMVTHYLGLMQSTELTLDEKRVDEKALSFGRQVRVL